MDDDPIAFHVKRVHKAIFPVVKRAESRVDPDVHADAMNLMEAALVMLGFDREQAVFIVNGTYQ